MGIGSARTRAKCDLYGQTDSTRCSAVCIGGWRGVARHARVRWQCYHGCSYRARAPIHLGIQPSRRPSARPRKRPAVPVSGMGRTKLVKHLHVFLNFTTEHLTAPILGLITRCHQRSCVWTRSYASAEPIIVVTFQVVSIAELNKMVYRCLLSLPLRMLSSSSNYAHQIQTALKVGPRCQQLSLSENVQTVGEGPNRRQAETGRQKRRLGERQR